MQCKRVTASPSFSIERQAIPTTNLIRRIVPQGTRLGESKALGFGGDESDRRAAEGRRGN
ncbi:hypothetical protein P355_2351 [Burkholderia cenocepacia KC-01]|nr:hypothetical protein P355_2351 [Burkholderia cenocepacia KC-01]